MTSFTTLHRLLGRRPGPLTDEMVDAAISEGVSEGTDLDFKGQLPPGRGLPQTDYPKDVAAMANSGGGTILYGVTEQQKRAVGRVDVGELTETHERSLHSAAYTAVSPPIFGLQVEQLGEPGGRCVAIIVPASVTGPHLIYRDGRFGAPRRTDADTVWMDEPQIEAMYRARFNHRQGLTEQLEGLYAQTALGRDIAVRAWLIAAAAPQRPAVRATRMSRDEARDCFEAGDRAALQLADRHRGGSRPLDVVDRSNPRTGLRSWTAPPVTGSQRWRESWAGIGRYGTVILATAIGGHAYARDQVLPGHQVESLALELAVADFLGLVRAVAEHLGTDDYDTLIGIEWAGSETVTILERDEFGYPRTPSDSSAMPFIPVRSTITAGADHDAYRRDVHDIALDCVNQGGIAQTSLIQPSPAAAPA